MDRMERQRRQFPFRKGSEGFSSDKEMVAPVNSRTMSLRIGNNIREGI